jgi:hypothetical protein
MTPDPKFDQRILVLAPIGRDAAAAAMHLAESQWDCAICANMDDLLAKLAEGAALALVAEEAFLRDSTRTKALEQWADDQPPWSDFPFLILTSRDTSAAAHKYRFRLLERLGNVSLLERPLHTETLLSAVGSAFRARRRHY